MIRVEEEFKSLIPPLTTEEKSQLEQNIVVDGCRDPLVVWNGVLVDGHNRYEICTRLNIPFATKEMQFEDRSHVTEWIIKNQFGRRNLLPYVRTQLALKLESEYAARAKINQGARTDICQISDKGIIAVDTKREIAKLAGVSHDTVAKVKKIEAFATAKTKAALATGEVSINAAYKQVAKSSKKEARKKYVEDRMTNIAPAADRYSCKTKSCADLLQMPECSVDWVITDPPYPREYLSVYDDLAKVAARVLKPGGSLLCMVGQSYLPEIISKLTAELSYHWTISYLTPGGKAAQLFTRNVNTFWKPILWLTKGEYTGQWIGDTTKSNVNDNDKNHHHWGQSCSGMKDLMSRFVKPGDIVLDPFMGAGTTGLVALDLGCYFIGHDIDQSAVNESLVRLADAEA